MVNMWLYSVLDMGSCGGIIMEIPKNIIHRNRRYEYETIGGAYEQSREKKNCQKM